MQTGSWLSSLVDGVDWVDGVDKSGLPAAPGRLLLYILPVGTVEGVTAQTHSPIYAR